MVNLRNTSSTIFVKGGKEEYFLGRKLCLLAKMALLSKELDDTTQYSVDDSIEYLVSTLCETKKLWLSKEEYDTLLKDGSLTKEVRFQEVNGYVLVLTVKDSEGFYVDTAELENNCRIYLTRDMISSVELIKDSVVTINVRH